MLKFSHFLPVYTVSLIVLSVLTPAQTKAETQTAPETARLNSRQFAELKQSVSRNPDALHSKDLPTRRKQDLSVSPDFSESHTGNSSSHKEISNFPSRPTRQPSVIESTLMGNAERWMGNFQPSRGAQPGNGSKRPLKTKIHIFKGKIKSQNNPILLSAANLPKVYSVVNSDENGSFQVQLPPGEYTLFLELEDGRLYRNSFDGEGNFSTVNITNGENTWDNLIDSREAFF